MGSSRALRSSFEAKVVVAFVAAALVVLVSLVATWKLARDANTAMLWIQHTLEVISDLNQASVDSLSVELSSQNYRVSGDPVHLATRDETIRMRNETLARLEALVSDHPRQLESLAQLRKVIDERLMISREVERIRGSTGAEAANAYVASTSLAQLREQLYSILGDMRGEEDRLLAQRTAQQRVARQALLVAGTVFALSLFSLLVATYLLIRRQVRETRLAQEEVAESRDDLYTTLQSIGDAVLATDRHGRITRMNPVAERLTGWTFGQAEGVPIEDVFNIVNEKTGRPAHIPVADVIRTGEVRGLANHTRIIARDGSEYPIADSAAPIRDAAGQIRGAVLVFRDVTIEQQAQRIVEGQNEELSGRVREQTAQLRESEAHLRSVINNVPAMIAFVDAEQRYVYVNRLYHEQFGPGIPDLVGRRVRDVLGESRYETARPRIEAALNGEPQSYDWTPFEGVWQTIVYIPRRDENDLLSGYYVLGTDITERKRSEAEIQGLNRALQKRLDDLEHLSRALRAIDAGNRAQLNSVSEHDLVASVCKAVVGTGGYSRVSVWYVTMAGEATLTPMADSGTTADGDILPPQRIAVEMGMDREGGLSRAVRSGVSVVLGELDRDPEFGPLRDHLPGCASALFCTLRIEGKAIGALAVFGAQANAFVDDEVALLTQLANDLSIGIATQRAKADQQRAQSALHRATRFDALTDLPNETRFTECLIDEIMHRDSLGQSLGVMQANIQGMSDVNLAFGFTCGDQVLREFGRRLQSVLPAGATVARLRGDEFAVLLPGGDIASMRQLADMVEIALQPAFRFGEIALDVSARFGIAVFPQHGRTPHDLLRSADIAVHQANLRRSPIVVFDASRIPDHTTRLKRVGELRHGIRDNQLRLYLQPKIDMTTGRVCGAEGLVRWMHPVEGLIGPGEFIELAENAGLIDALTLWVIEAAVAQIRELQLVGCAVPISVNLSVRNLRDEELVAKVGRILEKHQVSPHMLEFEVTETAAMDDPELALGVLRDLRHAGLQLSLDDFGTGYSSLRYLQRLPVNYIKIDQSFVRDMGTNPESAMIVRSTIELVRELGRKTVAEGVETPEDWVALSKFRCDIAQGYLIAKPMPAEHFCVWMHDYPGVMNAAQ